MSKRYQIWDKTSKVITPIGEVLTPEEWITRYPMAGLEGIKIVLAGGVINGAICMEFSTMVDNYINAGCDFSGCVEDQDYLDAMEAFEDAQKVAAASTISTQERIASALEAQVMLSLPDEEDV